MHPLHPMVVHFPIALLVTAVVFEALALWRRSERLRTTSLDMLVVGVLSAGVAIVTGHMAEEAAERAGIPEQVLELHETPAFVAFWIFLALLGLRLAIRRELVREKPVLSLALGLAGVMVLLVASYFGGDLVYGFGAGVVLK